MSLHTSCTFEEMWTNWDKFQPMSCVILLVLSIAFKWYLTKLYMSPMCTIKYKSGDQEKFLNVFHHSGFGRRREDWNLNLNLFWLWRYLDIWRIKELNKYLWDGGDDILSSGWYSFFFLSIKEYKLFGSARGPVYLDDIIEWWQLCGGKPFQIMRAFNYLVG